MPEREFLKIGVFHSRDYKFHKLDLMVKKKKSKQVVSAQTSLGESQILTLEKIAEKRIGGAVNIKGINFQILYSILSILKFLKPGQQNTIVLEGIEDLDLYLDTGDEYIQAKTSNTDIDASKFWDLGVLQNFYQVFRIKPASSFRVVVNFGFAKGMLSFFKSSTINADVLEYWHKKFQSSGYPISNTELETFLCQIAVENINIDEIFNAIIEILHREYSINLGTENNFIRALFYNVFDWAKNRQKITSIDLTQLIQSVTDSFSKFPVNQALQNEWISEISYTVDNASVKDQRYYDGKAARPVDIALGLNVRRPYWETEIEKSLEQYDVTVIKSSSGQGKSTLAYQVGKTAAEKNNKVYRIDYCPSFNEASHISDFLETRLKIGEMPIVLVDGLNQAVMGWSLIAERLYNKPIKIVVTSREEDWQRYPINLLSVSVNEINISLSQVEAKAIFEGLNQHGRIDQNVTDWQPSWERVKGTGLLIEYVFLLTQGQMITERLRGQVAAINSERDSGAKLEILRLITLADVLNIRLRTQKITDYILDKFSLQTDRNELYRQLEKEYYVNFEKIYIQGLHPVRSRHLVAILNSHIGVETPLITLLKLIDEDYVYEYFINVLIQFQSIDIGTFLNRVAHVIGKQDLTTMVFSIDGIMHSEPYKYWNENKAIFDNAFAKGGFLLFVYQLLPFSSISIIDDLAESLSGELRENMRAMSALAKKLPKYAIESSVVYQLIRELGSVLTDRGKIHRHEGITFLYKWFKTVGVPFPDIAVINEQDLLQTLADKDISEASEVFHFYHLTKPKEYKYFVDKNWATIVGWIKQKSETLSIWVDGSDININYLLNSSEKANEQSVYRINIVQAFLPGYSRYCTEAIILPFPNEAIYKAVVTDSTKHIRQKIYLTILTFT